MYIYFKLTNSVLTCEYCPQIISVEEMKLNNLENMCNKWEKTDIEGGTFMLSFICKKEICGCDNSRYTNIKDYDKYECYNCCTLKTQIDVNFYLQHSDDMGVIYVKPTNNFCLISQVDGYPNIYKWSHPGNKHIYILHINDNMLSDRYVSNEINSIQDSCHILFTECI